MRSRVRRSAVSITAVIGALTLGVGGAGAAPTSPQPVEDGAVTDAALRRDGQHGGPDGHLPPTRKNVDVVGRGLIQDGPGHVSDVGVFGDYAYLGGHSDPDCTKGGVYVFDIKNLARPRQVAFIPTAPGTYVSEGVQVVKLRTPSFRGDVLIFNNEICGDDPAAVGGATLVDVTNPRSPRVLSAGFGDLTPENPDAPTLAHQSHSAYVWQAGRKAYAALVDDEEVADVDIFDVTDPTRPAPVAEYALAELFPQILQPGLDEVFLHDMVVKQIRGRQIMLASYWDAGYVKLDVTDPTRPAYLADSDFTDPDPELLAQTGKRLAPEGNGHQGEFTKDNRYIVAADEDFNPDVVLGSTDDGGSFKATPGAQEGTVDVTGKAVYAGLACPTGDPVPAPPATGGPYVAVVERGGCTFTEKAAAVEAVTANGGYAAMVVFNREGADGCGDFAMTIENTRPAFSISRAAGYGSFDLAYDEAECRAGDGTATAPIPLGTVGDTVTLRTEFDGWGYVHLFKNNSTGKLTELDTYAIPEAMDPSKASGSGALSVHEAATSATRSDLVYFSYYAGGFRVAKIKNNRLVEVGRFIDRGGNDFWGVEVFTRGGKEYVAASDRDSGLYIFRYTGR
jgi:hypothetical protein